MAYATSEIRIGRGWGGAGSRGDCSCRGGGWGGAGGWGCTCGDLWRGRKQWGGATPVAPCCHGEGWEVATNARPWQSGELGG